MSNVIMVIYYRFNSSAKWQYQLSTSIISSRHNRAAFVAIGALSHADPITPRPKTFEHGTLS
jgi:hypothetical protein